MPDLDPAAVEAANESVVDRLSNALAEARASLAEYEADVLDLRGKLQTWERNAGEYRAELAEARASLERAHRKIGEADSLLGPWGGTPAGTVGAIHNLISDHDEAVARAEAAERERAIERTSVDQLPAAVEAKRHAHWCTYEHDGPCPAENAPAPDHPVWRELAEARASLEREREYYGALQDEYARLSAERDEAVARAEARMQDVLTWQRKALEARSAVARLEARINEYDVATANAELRAARLEAENAELRRIR